MKILQFIISLMRNLFMRKRFTPEAVQNHSTPVKRELNAEKRKHYGMKDLLSSLSETFRVLRLPYGRGSWLGKSEAIGLRKLGVHVVYDPRGVWQPGQITVPTGELPAMVCVSYGLSKFDAPDDAPHGADNIHPAIFFAIKNTSLPVFVDPCHGQHFFFGLAFRVGENSKTDKCKSLFWLAGYITVRADGSLHLHRERKTRTIAIKSRVRKGASRGGCHYLTRQQWGMASLAQVLDEKRQQGEHSCMEGFANTMRWWMRRDDNWSVTVRKDGERVTFAVPKEDTKVFFRDRIKVKTPSGQTKKIIHYVNSHDRKIDGERVTTVKEHIRGLERFEWNGYHVSVTAPGFNGQLSTSFTIASHVVSDDDEIDVDTRQMIDISKVGATLANYEEPIPRSATIH